MGDQTATGRRTAFVDTAEGLARALEEWRAQPALAVDTESNSFFVYRERVCLLQVSSRDADWIVDPLGADLAPLGPLFADEGVEKVFHACEYDVLSLKREHGFVFRNVFDTLVAARALGVRQVGLGNLVHERLHVALAKDEQRSDWGRRPLTPTQIEYAFSDTRHLLALADLLKAELAARGPDLVREVAVDCARATQKEPRPKEVDTEAFERHPSARRLDPVSRQVLRSLYLAREARAQATDRPVFRVAPDQLLGEIAARKPVTREELAKVPGMSPAILGRHGAAFLAAVQEAVALGPLVKKRRPPGPPFDPAEEERFEALRRWRKAVAEARGVEVDVVAGNAALRAVARANPATSQALAAVGELDLWRVERYGDAILAALRGRAGR